MEMAKLKMQARLSEDEATADQLNAKLSQVEKSKVKLQADLDSAAAKLVGLGWVGWVGLVGLGRVG